jgi:signal transduction histidine kinase
LSWSGTTRTLRAVCAGGVGGRGAPHPPQGRFALVNRDEAGDARVEYVPIVKLLALARRRVFDIVILLGAAGGTLEAVLRRNDPVAPTHVWLSVAVVLGITLPLLARRRAPFGVPIGMFLFAAGISFVDGDLVPFTFATLLAVLGACFLVGLLADRRQALGGLAIALAAGLVVVRNDSDVASEDYVGIPLLFSIVWLAGLALGGKLREARAAEERARRAVEEREERALAAVAEERQRIARELHDVVAHSVSVMTVQAGGVRRLLRDNQVREREALLLVEETGRQALAEMRRLLGILRQPTEQPALSPQPGMTSLGGLIEQVREAGLPVEFRIQGEPVPLPPGIDLSAYRIVQEALTNALKHAGPARAKVCVRYRPESLELEIENDGRIDGDGESGGQGLVGMQERVSLYGGMLESGPRGGGGYAVRARLPVREER